MASPERIEWPQDKRVAVVVSVLLETCAEGKSPTDFPRLTPLKPGTPDLPGREWFRALGVECIGSDQRSRSQAEQ